MLRTAASTTVLNSLERFIEMFPDVEDWLKENLDINQVHWDGYENFRRIVESYFDQQPGEFTILSNRHDESVMVIEIEEISYCITGEVAGPDCKIHFGTREELERFYLTYARKNHNSDLTSFQDAKMWVEENWDSANGIILF